MERPPRPGFSDGRDELTPFLSKAKLRGATLKQNDSETIDHAYKDLSFAELNGQPSAALQVNENDTYIVSLLARRKTQGALVDRGANGGILGNDARVFYTHQRKVNVRGIDNHEMPDLKIVDATAKVITQRGPVIIVLNQYAYTGVDRTIHSSGQIEYYRNQVHDRSIRVGGKQHIQTNDGYMIPLDIINGLPYMQMETHTDQEWEDLPHVILTEGAPWNPKVLDNVISDRADWYNTLKDFEQGTTQSPFDEKGNYKQRQQIVGTEPVPEIPNEPETIDEITVHAQPGIIRATFAELFKVNDRRFNDELEAHPIEVKQAPIDYEQLRKYFLHVPAHKVKKTFEKTTQFATNVMSGHRIHDTIQSPFPACNIHRRNEPVASDTIKAEVPAVDSGGQDKGQLYIGRKSLVADIFGMTSEKEFVNTLEDEIRQRGAMDMLITDSARVETSDRVNEVLRAYRIKDWQSEPHYQHQNFAEHRWKHIKGYTEWYMNWRDVQPNAWLLLAKWVCDIANHTAERSLGWRTPLEVLTGQTTDISILLLFLFWDIVYVTRYAEEEYSNQIGSKKSSEIRGRFVGFAWHVGHALTFKVLTDDTQKVISRSRLRLSKEGENNLRLDTLAGDARPKVLLKSVHQDKHGEDKPLPTVNIGTDPFTIEDLPGYVMENEPDTPLDRPIKDQPIVETVEDPDQDAPEPVKARKPGQVNPNLDPLELQGKLRTTNPTVKDKLMPNEVVGRSFLMPPGEDGQRFRAFIKERITLTRKELLKDPAMIKFRARINNSYDDVVSYNDIINFIEQDDDFDGVWRYKQILDHQGPLNRKITGIRGAATMF